MRGLADSGQANIAQVQSQTAYGETISGLYGQKQAVEQQAVQQRQLIEQSVAAATEQTNIQRGQQQLQSDTQLFEQVTAIEDNKKAQIASLVELSMSGQYTPDQLKTLAEAYGVTEDDLTIVMNASSYFDPTGDLQIRERWDWGAIGEAALAGGATGGTIGLIGGPAAAAFGAVVGATLGLGAGIGNQIVNSLIGTMSVSSGPNSEPITGRPDEVVAQIRQRYSGFEGSDQILPTIDYSTLGQRDKVVFVYNGQRYNTYNEALRALKGIRTE
jgi:hypothetical protein